MTIFKPAIKQKKLKSEIYCDDNIPDVLYGNELLLHRIILNLLGNAVKFTEKGSISLEASLIQQRKNSAMIKLLVKDTGIGIPADKTHVIFDKFSRLSPSYSNQYKGTGLGLYMVKEFIQKLGGDIQVTSIEGKGSQFSCTFQFQMPTKKQLQLHLAENEPDLKPTQKKAVAKPRQVTTQPLRVLLVEDSPLPRKIAETLLAETGYLVDTAETAADAIQKSNQTSYDLIYMDIGLPDGSGIDVTRHIRDHATGPNLNTFIVALTAHADPDIKQSCLDSGMQATLEKPLSAEKIQDVASHFSTIVKPCAKQENNKYTKPDLIDLERGARIVGGDMALAKEVLDTLIQNLPAVQAQIVDDYEKQDWPLLQHHVHKLHGELCYSAAIALKELTNDFENQLKSRSNEREVTYQKFIKMIDATLDEYRNA